MAEDNFFTHQENKIPSKSAEFLFLGLKTVKTIVKPKLYVNTVN